MNGQVYSNNEWYNKFTKIVSVPYPPQPPPPLGCYSHHCACEGEVIFPNFVSAIGNVLNFNDALYSPMYEYHYRQWFKKVWIKYWHFMTSCSKLYHVAVCNRLLRGPCAVDPTWENDASKRNLEIARKRHGSYFHTWQQLSEAPSPGDNSRG